MESNDKEPEVVSSASAPDEQPNIQSQDKPIIDSKSKERAIKVNRYRQVVSKYARTRRNQNNFTSKEASGENKEYVRIVDMKNHQKARDRCSLDARDETGHNSGDKLDQEAIGHAARDKFDYEARDGHDHDSRDKLDHQATDGPTYDDNDKPGFESKGISGGCNVTDENMCQQMEETDKDLSEESDLHRRKRKIDLDSDEPKLKCMLVENGPGCSVGSENPKKGDTKDLSPNLNSTEKDNYGNSDMSPNSIKMKFIRTINKEDNGDTSLSEYTVQTEVFEYGADTDNIQVSKMICEDEINNNFHSENITETKLSEQQDERQNLVKDCSVKVEKIRFQSKRKMSGYCHGNQDWKTSLKIKQASNGSFIIVDKCESEYANNTMNTNKSCLVENIIEKRSPKWSTKNTLIESETSDEECLDDKVEKRAVVVLTDIIQEIGDVNKDLMHDKNKADRVKTKENLNKWNVKEKSRYLQISVTKNDPQIRSLESEHRHKGREEKYLCSPKVISGIKRSKDKRGDENLSTEMSILRQFVSKEKRSSDQVIDCDIGPGDNKCNTNSAIPENESDFEESEAPIETNKNKTEKVSLKVTNENTTEKVFLQETFENNSEKVSMKDVNENNIPRVQIKDTNENNTKRVGIKATDEINTEAVSLKEDSTIDSEKDGETSPSKNEDYKVINHCSDESKIGNSDIKDFELSNEAIEKHESDTELHLKLPDSVIDSSKSENAPEGNSQISDFGIIHDGGNNVDYIHKEEMKTMNSKRDCFKRKNEDCIKKVQNSPNTVIEKESASETVKVKLPNLEGSVSPKVIQSKSPTLKESNSPTLKDSKSPTLKESKSPTSKESNSPKLKVAKSPTLKESKSPKLKVAKSPTLKLSKSTTLKESKSPNLSEAESPTLKESKSPTLKESKSPTSKESNSPKLKVAKSPTLKESKSPKLKVAKSPTLILSKSPTLKESKSPTLKVSKSPTVKESKSPTVKESKSQNLSEAESPKLKVAKLLKLKMEKSLNLKVEKSPKLKVVKSPNLSEGKSPKPLKLKIVKSPNLKETKSPNSEAKSLILMEANSPNLMEANLPNLMEAKSPNLMEAKSPNLMEAKSPNLMEAKSPKLNQAKSPDWNETNSPKSLKLKEIKSPKLKEAKPPNLTETNSPKFKDKKAPKQKRSKSTKPKGVKSPELKEAKPLEPKLIDSPKLKETKAPKLKAMFHRCSSCEMTFGLCSELRAHKRADHPNECQKCGMVFFNQAAMKEHLKTHAKFTCHQCDKRFLNLKGYTYHLATITHAKVAAAIAVKNGKKEQKRKEEELISAVASIQEHQQYSVQGNQLPMEEGPYHTYDNVNYSGSVPQLDPTQSLDYNHNGSMVDGYSSSYSWTAWMNESYQPISHEFMDQDQQTNVLYSSNNYVPDYNNNMLTYDTNTSVDQNLQPSATQQFNQYPNQNNCVRDEFGMNSKKSMSYFYQGYDNTSFGNDLQMSYNTTQEVPNNQHVMFETNSNQVINLQEVPGTEQLAYETNGNLSQNYQEVPRNELQGFNTSVNGSQVENYQQVPQHGQFSEFTHMNIDNQTQTVSYNMYNPQQSTMTCTDQGYENIQPLLPASGAVPVSSFSEMETSFTEL